MIFLIFVSITAWVLWSIYSCFVYRRRSVVGKTVLIAGGSSAVGKRIVMQFMKLDARVIVWDNNEKKLKQLIQDVNAERQSQRGSDISDAPTSNNSEFMGLRLRDIDSAARLSTHVVDLSSHSELLRAARLLGGPVHIVINATEVHVPKHFFDREDRSTENILLSSALPSLVLAREFLPSMLQRKDGVFVTIATTAGIIGDAANPDYAASQWASIGAHESIQMLIRQMGGSENVRCSLVCASRAFQSSAAPLTNNKKSVNVETEQKGSVTDVRSTRFPFLSRSLTADDVAKTCVWAISHGVERVYMPGTLLFIPLLRVLPVPWLLRIISPRSWRRSFFTN